MENNQTLAVNEAPKLLPALQNNEYAVALIGKKIRDASEMEVDMRITAAIERANLDLGLTNVNETDNGYMCDELLRIAMRDFKNMTLDEIMLATNKGVHGLYDSEKVYKPTVVIVTRWWHHFTQDIARNLARKEMEKANKVEEERKVTLADAMTNIKRAFTTYKAEQYFDDYGSHIFDMINKAGKIPFDDAKIDELWKKAIIMADQKNKALPKDIADRDKKREAISELLKGDMSQIVIISKRLILFQLFDYLIANELGIEEYLTTK